MICMCTNYFKHNLQLINKFLTDIELVRLFLHHHLMLLQVLLQVGCHAKLFVTVDTVEVKLVRCLLVRPQVPLVEEDHRALFTLDRPVHLVVHNLVQEKREKREKRERREEKTLCSSRSFCEVLDHPQIRHFRKYILVVRRSFVFVFFSSSSPCSLFSVPSPASLLNSFSCSSTLQTEYFQGE